MGLLCGAYQTLRPHNGLGVVRLARVPCEPLICTFYNSLSEYNYYSSYIR